MPAMKLSHLASHLVLVAASLGCMASANAAFTGSAAPAQWTSANTDGGNGSASNDGSTLTLVSSNFADFDAAPLVSSTFSYATTFAAPTTLSFNWSYATADDGGSSNDRFGYTLNGTSYALSSDGLWDGQSGSVSLSLAAGSHFGFTMTSTDSIFGAATATVSGFSVSPVPEADPLLLLGVGLPLVAGVSLRRRRRAA